MKEEGIGMPEILCLLENNLFLAAAPDSYIKHFFIAPRIELKFSTAAKEKLHSSWKVTSGDKRAREMRWFCFWNSREFK